MTVIRHHNSMLAIADNAVDAMLLAGDKRTPVATGRCVVGTTFYDWRALVSWETARQAIRKAATGKELRFLN